MIRPATIDDAAAIAAIYNPFIEDTIVSFEETAVSPGDIATRMGNVEKQALPWLVLEVEDRVVGYAYAGRWQVRTAYRFTVESTIYLAPHAHGQGLGAFLYRTLIDELRRRPVHAVIGGISLPNAASVALHEKLGFAKVSHYSEVGYKFGRWIDVGYWQLMIPLARPNSGAATI